MHTKFEHIIYQIIWVLRNFCKVIIYKFTQSSNTAYIIYFEFYAIFAKWSLTNSHTVWSHHILNNLGSTQILQSNCPQIHTKVEHTICQIIWVLRNFCKVIAYIFTQSLNTPYIKYLEFYAIFAKQLPTNSREVWAHHISNNLSSTRFMQSNCLQFHTTFEDTICQIVWVLHQFLRSNYLQIHTKSEHTIYQIIWGLRNFCKLIAYNFALSLSTPYIK